MLSQVPLSALVIGRSFIDFNHVYSDVLVFLIWKMPMDFLLTCSSCINSWKQRSLVNRWCESVVWNPLPYLHVPRLLHRSAGDNRGATLLPLHPL